MHSWFRSWHGAPTDPKWRVVARVAEADLIEVIGLAWFLLDVASQSSDRGSIAGYDTETIGAATNLDPAAVARVIQAMHDRNILINNRFAAWDERQPRREDNSKDRVTRHRERVRNEAQRPVTQRNAPDKDTEKDKEESKRGTPPSPSSPVASVQVESPTKPKPIDLGAKRSRQGEYENELFQAVFEACGLDETCSDAAWKGVQKVVASFASRGRDGPFIRGQAAWFAKEHWKGQRGELPSPGDLLDTAVQFERGVKRTKADNGFKTRSDRNLENLADIAEHFGLSEISGNGGGDHESGHLLGPGDPVEVGVVGDGLGLGRGHRQTDRAD